MANETLFSVGGIGLSITGTTSMEHLLNLPGFGPFRTAQCPPDTTHIALDEALPLPECRWLHRFDIANGEAPCRFGIDSDGAYHYTLGDTGHVRFDPRTPNKAQINTIEDATLLRFALWTAYSMLGLWRGRVPVHSSVVVCQGRAVLCLGESGTGKSTHTSLWLKHIPDTYLLNDDSPIIALEEGEAVVYGSPWSGKTHCYTPRRVPIAAILRLEQRPANSIRRLATIGAFTALQPSCPPSLGYDEHCMDRLASLIGGIIQRVPLYHLGCLPDAEAALLSHNTIFSEP